MICSRSSSASRPKPERACGRRRRHLVPPRRQFQCFSRLTPPRWCRLRAVFPPVVYLSWPATVAALDRKSGHEQQRSTGCAPGVPLGVRSGDLCGRICRRVRFVFELIRCTHGQSRAVSPLGGVITIVMGPAFVGLIPMLQRDTRIQPR